MKLSKMRKTQNFVDYRNKPPEFSVRQQEQRTAWANKRQKDQEKWKAIGRSSNPVARAVGRAAYDMGRQGPSRGRTFGVKRKVTG